VALKGASHNIINLNQRLTVDGESLTVDGEPMTVDGEPMTVDGEPVTVDGEPMTVDGEPLTVDREPLTVPVTLECENRPYGRTLLPPRRTGLPARALYDGIERINGKNTANINE
jgi:hypothetical protein